LVLLLDVRLLGGGTGVVDQRGERPHLVLGPAEHRLDIVFGADIRAPTARPPVPVMADTTDFGPSASAV
jgi:hypothetical protein